MIKERTWISVGDFLDLKYKVKHKGLSGLQSILRFSGQKRSINKLG